MVKAEEKRGETNKKLDEHINKLKKMTEEKNTCQKKNKDLLK